jgi:hypothetical protein
MGSVQASIESSLMSWTATILGPSALHWGRYGALRTYSMESSPSSCDNDLGPVVSVIGILPWVICASEWGHEELFARQPATKRGDAMTGGACAYSTRDRLIPGSQNWFSGGGKSHRIDGRCVG